MEITLEKVQEYIEQNKEADEVKNYLQGLAKPTLEGVQSFLETEDGKKVLQPKLDSFFSKGLETWKQNNLQKLLEEEITKRYPEEDEKDKQLKEIQLKLQQMEQEKLYESLKNKALTIATEKKIPTSIIDLMIGKDEESTIANLSRFEEVMNPYIQSIVEERIKAGSYIPPGDKDTKTITKESIKTMSQEEINANWDAVQQVLSGN